MNQEITNEQQWRRLAHRLRFRVNFGHFLDVLIPVIIFTSILFCIVTLILRRESSFITTSHILIVSSVLLFLCSVPSYLVAKRKFETVADSLVRLDGIFSRQLALPTAAAEIAPWPTAPEKLDIKSLSWRKVRLISPLVGAIALVITAIFLPLPEIDEKPIAQAPEPAAWDQLSEEIEQLAKENLVDQEYLEKVQEQLNSLRKQEQKDKFSYSSLEATDNLVQSHLLNRQKLSDTLNEMQRNLEELSQNETAKNLAEQQQLLNQLKAAKEALENGAMKPNSELLKQMQKLDPKNLNNLTQEQLQQMKEQMQQLQESLQKGEPNNWGNQQNEKPKEGGEDCDSCKGQGGIQRGPGHDPDVLGNQKNLLNEGQLQALSAEDLSRLTPGDLLKLQNTEHQVDKTQSTISAGGKATQGRGGNRTWSESLSPAEQRAIQKYFD